MPESDARSSLPEYSVGEFCILAESLLNSLQQEIRVYGKLFELIKKEREIIRSPSIEALNANNSKKEACLLEAGLCQQNREETIKEFKKILSIDDQTEITLSLISSYVENNLKQQLLDCREKLSSLINAVKNCNEQNKCLLRDSISCTRATLTFIQTLTTSSPMNYMPSGQLHMELQNGRILNKEG